MFEWQPDGYGQLLENKRQEMKDSKEATLKVHKGEVFKTGVKKKRLKQRWEEVCVCACVCVCVCVCDYADLCKCDD